MASQIFGQRSVSVLIWCMAICLGIMSKSEATIVRFDTSLGDIDVRLVESLTPNSAANFLNYVNTDRYSGTFIHRVPQTIGPGPIIGVPMSLDFVVQGGGFRLNGSILEAEGIETDEPIGDEFNISNTRGTLAFAKNDAGATSQWFFNLRDNSGLDSQDFTVFGRVLGDGMDVVDAINDLQVVNAVPAADPFTGEDFDEIPVLDVEKVLQQQDILPEDAVMIWSVEVLPLPEGDYNFDGVVNLADYTIWRNTLGSTENIAADGNGNGLVDQADYAIWVTNFGSSAPAALNTTLAPVPEPSGVCLFAVATGLLWLARKKAGLE